MKTLDEILYCNFSKIIFNASYLFQFWINLTSWGFVINFTDGFTMQLLCFYMSIDKEYDLKEVE